GSDRQDLPTAHHPAGRPRGRPRRARRSLRPGGRRTRLILPPSTPPDRATGSPPAALLCRDGGPGRRVDDRTPRRSTRAMTYWLAHVGKDRPEGPYTKAELSRKYEAGEAHLQDQVCLQG